MTKALIAGIIIGIVVVGAGVTYFVVKKSKPNQQSVSNHSTQAQTQQPSSNESRTNSNLFALAESGKSQKCTFSYSGENGNSNGTVYSDGNKRGLMKMNIATKQGNSGESNTLFLNNKIYTWTISNGNTFGMVFDRDTLETQKQQPTTPSTLPSNQSAEQISHSYDMDCQPWSVDETMLTVPTNINFSSMPTAPTNP